MPNVWFTADTHLGHANIIKFCQRPFMSAEESQAIESDPRVPLKLSRETVIRHDDALLQAINDRVMPDDELWVLGDFCWGKLDLAEKYRSRIACRNVHLVWGNHDHRSIRPVFSQAIEQGMINVKGQKIWLNHYPMRSWHKRFHGSWHLYGHVHNQMADEDEQMVTLLTKDVGVDACNYLPISFDQLVRYMEPRVEAFNRNRDVII